MNFNPQETFRKQPMVFIALAFIIGNISSRNLNASIIVPIIAGILFVLYLVARKWKYSYLIMLLMMIVFGFTFSSHQNDNFRKYLAEVKTFAEKPTEYIGIVHKVNKYSSGQRITLINVQIKSEHLYHDNNIKYFVYPKDQIIDNDSIRDTLKGNGKFQLYNDIRNPGEYYYKRYYHMMRITGRIYFNSKLQVFSNPNWSLIKSINNFRENVRTKLTAYSDGETAALLSVLILGDRTHIDQELRESFANVGVIHVLAVSGLHVGYWT